MTPGETIAVWFSCGAASAVAAKLTIERYQGVANVRLVNNPVAEEDADNLRFLADVQDWLGVEIETARHPDFPSAKAVDVWKRERFMSGVHGAPCTKFLKKLARQFFEQDNHLDWHVLGFTADEKARSDRFMLTERENVLPVLVQEGITKTDCFQIVQEAGIELPAIYKAGFPNANCIGCVKATSPTYWNRVREVYPEVFEERAKQSRELGARLVRVKNERIFLDELDSSAKGRPLKKTGVECGIFCEERA